MRTPTFEKPLSLGHIDPMLLDKLAKNSKQGMSWTSWREGELHSNNKHLGEILAGVTLQLLELCESRDECVRTIQYEVDTSPMPAGGHQRGPRWHIDGVAGPAVIVADRMPTEVLIHNQHSQESAILPKPKRYEFADIDIHREIDRGTLGVYTPEPYELIMMEKHVHRSPVNPTDRTLPRTFLRAFLFGDSWR